MLTNITIEEAKNIILKQNIKLNIIEKPILDSLDYVLGEDIISNMNMPPFDRSPLDGYALKSEDILHATKDNPVTLKVIDYIPAGYVSSKTIENGQAIRIMTGAKIPKGADIIIRYEDTDFTEEEVKIYEYLKPNSNIVKAGEDIRLGDIILKKGHIIGPADVGILATLGIDRVKVFSKPTVSILATGDELVDIDKPLIAGKIRNSNSYTIAAQVKKIGANPIIGGIYMDTIEDIKRGLLSHLEGADIIITTGGVSVGDRDVVKEAFEEIGAKILFWKIKIKPGSPIVVARYVDKLIFGLSGNPAACYITFEKFVVPVILRAMGNNYREFMKVKSILKNGFTKVSKQNRYVRGKTYYENGKFYTLLADKHSSGVLSSLSGANSLFYVAGGTGPYKEGDAVEVELLDWLVE